MCWYTLAWAHRVAIHPLGCTHNSGSTQGFLSQRCNLKQRSQGVSSRCKVTTSNKTNKQTFFSGPRWKHTLTSHLQTCLCTEGQLRDRNKCSAWMCCRSQKLTMCKYFHTRLRQQPRKKGSLKCPKFMSKKMGWLSYKTDSTNFSNSSFLLDAKYVRNSLLLLIHEFKWWDQNKMGEKASVTS